MSLQRIPFVLLNINLEYCLLVILLLNQLFFEWEMVIVMEIFSKVESINLDLSTSIVFFLVLLKYLEHVGFPSVTDEKWYRR